MPDGTFQMSFPTAPTARVPHLSVNTDTGPFVYAVAQMPPGKTYMAAGDECSWPQFLETWGQVNKVPVKYQELTLQQFIDVAPDKEMGKEIGDMFVYSSDPGYDGGDRSILKAADIEKVSTWSIDAPGTSLTFRFPGGSSMPYDFGQGVFRGP